MTARRLFVSCLVVATLGLSACAEPEAGRQASSACEQLHANIQACFGEAAAPTQCDEAAASELVDLTCEELEEQDAKQDGLGCGLLPFLPWCDDEPEVEPLGEPIAWPNEFSNANSDPWIAQHHREINQMRPRVLALNFVNARSMSEMDAQLQDMRDIIAESSRWHGYDDPTAPTFLEYEIAYSVDMRDPMPPADWPYTNSTLYPRDEEPDDGYWSFDYEKLFSKEYAEYYRIEDPDEPGTSLALCDAIDRGLVHEVWVYGNASVPDVTAAEVIELKPYYDMEGNRQPGAMDRCAGNGCFDEEDVIPCSRSIRVAWFNDSRGPGCFLEGHSHAFEGMGRRYSTVLPYLSKYFSEFSGMELDTDYDAPVSNWYACHYGEDCLSYSDESTVEYAIKDKDGVLVHEGTLEDYDPVCGNVHWAPNSRLHYDMGGTDAVRTSCTHWRDGTGETELYDGWQHRAYDGVAPDCMGPFLMWWRQNIPGYDNNVIDDDGQPMLNWWPFLFY